MSEEKVRCDLDRVLGYPSVDVIWEYLVDKFYVEEVESEERSIKELAYEYRRIAQVARETSGRDRLVERGKGLGREVGRGEVRRTDAGNRLRDEIFHREASRLPDVVEWRKSNLGDFAGFVLAAAQVTPWLEEAGEKDWTPHGREGLAWLYCHDAEFRSNMFLTLPASTLGWMPEPPGVIVTPPDQPSEARLEFYEGPHYLKWVHEGETLFMEIPRDGKLIYLKAVAYVVSYRFCLREEEAVNYILSASTISPLAGDYRVVEPFFNPSRTFVSLTLDPAMSDKEVLALYNRARRHLPRTRKRPLSDQIMELVRFCHARVGFVSADRRAQRPWGDLMREWNRARPAEQRFEDERDFRKAYARALTGLFPPARYPLLWEAD